MLRAGCWGRFRFAAGGLSLFLLRPDLPVVFANNAVDVGLRLTVGRNPVLSFDALRTCIVSCEGLDQIEVVALQQFAEIAAAAVYVGAWIKRVVYSQFAGRARHQLHESLRTFGGNSARVESALGANHAVDQVRVEMERGACRGDDLVQIGCGLWRGS